MNTICLRKTTGVLLIFFMMVMTLGSLLIPSVSSTSSTYYVSTTGDDTNGDGSFNNPWRTIQNAANLVLAGDTVEVRGGTYYERVSINNKNGNPDAWITFRPYNNEDVIVDGRYIPAVNSWQAIFMITSTSSYIHITGFKVYNSAIRGFTVDGQWILMDYNQIYNCSSNAMLSYGSNISFQHNTVDWINNNWTGNGYGWSNEGISLSGAHGFDVSNNTISRSGKICIDVKVGCQYGAVHHNIINTSTWPGDQYVNLTGHSGIYCDAWDKRNYQIDIYNNYIYGDHGTGINCGAERNGSTDHIRIFNNIINVSYEFALGICPWASDVPMSNISIFSNTVIADNNYALRIKADNITGNGITGITICNNIFANKLYPTVVMIENYLPTDNKVILSNNLIYSYRGGNYKICWSSVSSWNETPNSIWGENSVLADPQLEHDFSLNGNSPAINNGTTVPISFDYQGNHRPDGMRFDIGAFEYSVNNPPLLPSENNPSSPSSENNPSPSSSVNNPPQTLNVNPIADTSPGGPYQGFINTEITFNGSRSQDPDGNITKWSWDFGDKTNGTEEITRHTYSKSGTYTVTLTVTDNLGATNTDTTSCVITQQNRPPTTPIITGQTNGTKNTIYTYTAVSTDLDNNSLQYTFDWGDHISQSSGFLPNGSSFTVNHNWAAAGRFSVTVTVTDNQTQSSSIITVYIDAVQTGNIGYLTDYSDGSYNVFHNDTTSRNTVVSKTGSNYLIDSNGDGKWEYTFDATKGLIPYQPSKTPGFEIIIIIVAIVLVMFLKRKRGGKD